MTKGQYIREIVWRSCLPAADRRRLKSDLESEIDSGLEHGESLEQVIARMGDPDQVAAGIYENFSDAAVRPFREYKSKRTLFGLPLVHIIRTNYAPSVPHFRTVSVRGVSAGARYARLGMPTARGVFAFGPKAKGVFAVGNLSAGFIAIGNLSIGILSIGNLSAGLFSIGNLTLALLIAIGNLTAGLLSAGNIAFGHAAAGNLASGRYAVGNEVAGTFTFSISNLPAQFEELRQFFIRLDAPAPVKAFYGVIERISEILMDPMSAIPLFIAFFIVLACIVLLLCLVPRRLLRRSV